MKRKVFATLMISVIVLASCSKKEEPVFLTAHPTTNEDDYAAYDYSDHTDSREAAYTTVLADLSVLAKGEPALAKKELPASWLGRPFEGLETKNDVFGYDARSCDISDVDLSVVEDTDDLTFDTDTKWPEKLPKGFDPEKILEFNKNPGLGIRALHKKGITGKGVSIAIIDQGLLLEHEQYKNNIKLYERIHCGDDVAQMHGPAVASIAAGKDIGVAPKANLYYIASTFGHFTDTDFEFDASIMADAILRILDINEKLDQDKKIRAISISKGYSRMDKGYDELQAAIKKADETNVFVVTTSTDEYYKGFTLFGMDRDYAKDPEDPNSYEPVSWIADDFYNKVYQNFLMFPIGSRTFAGCTNINDYAISHNGGLSWSVPWCVGLYALCCQEKPDITPQEFIDLANSTATTTEITNDGKTYTFGKIINPEKLIEQLKDK